MDKQKIKQNGVNILSAVVLVVVASYFISSLLISNRLRSIELDTRNQISEQQSLLTAIAEATSRNGADAVTELIVKDCSVTERSSFDELLGNLNKTLSKSQLVELERLFGRCGSFYSDRKSVMVSRLTREIEIYENYVNHLNIILKKDLNQEFNVDDWKKLAEEEKKQSELFSKLVVLQDKIITTLLSGKLATSEEIKTILQEVNEIQQALVFSKLQASEQRTKLTSL